MKLASGVFVSLLIALSPALSPAALVINPVSAPASAAPTLVTGSGARANGPVELFVNGVSMGSVQADGTGAWSMTVDIKADDVLHAEPNQVWNFNTDGDSEGWASPTESAAVANGILTVTEDNEENINNNMTIFLSGANIYDPSLTVIEIGYRTQAQAFQGIVLTVTDTGDPENPDPDPFGPQWIPLSGTPGFVTDVIDVSVKDVNIPNGDYPAGVTGGFGFGFNGFAFGETFEADYIRMRETMRFHFPYDDDTMGWGIPEFNFPPDHAGGVATGPVDGVLTVTAQGPGNVAIAPLDNGGPNRDGYVNFNASVFDRFNFRAQLDSTNSGQVFGMFYSTAWGVFQGPHAPAIAYTPSYDGFEYHSLDMSQLEGWSPQGAAVLNFTWLSFMYALAADEKAEFDYFQFAPSSFTGDSAPVTVTLGGGEPPVDGLVIDPAEAPPGGGSVEVSGSGANANGWVELFVNGVSQGSTRADVDGIWSITVTLEPGDELTAIPARVWNFSNDGDAEGWATVDGSLVVAGGVATITEGGSDGNVTLYFNEVDLADPNVQRVLEIGYTYAGTVTPPGVILTASDQGGPFGPNWVPTPSATFRADIVDLTSANFGVSANPGWSGELNQIGMGFNGAVDGDVFVVDFIRLRETLRWDFPYDGDLQGWAADSGAGNQTVLDGVAGGVVSLSPAEAGQNVAMVAPFGTLYPAVFNQYKVRMNQSSDNAGQAGGFGFFYNGPLNWTQDFVAIGPYTPDYGNFIITTADLSGDAEWNTPQVSPSLSHQFMFAPNATDSVVVDYVEFAAQSVIAEATPVVVTESTVEPPTLGDINDDGIINVADVTELANLVANGTPPDAAVGDVNGDENVDEADVEALASQIVN